MAPVAAKPLEFIPVFSPAELCKNDSGVRKKFSERRVLGQRLDFLQCLRHSLSVTQIRTFRTIIAQQLNIVDEQVVVSPAESLFYLQRRQSIENSLFNSAKKAKKGV